MQRANSGGLPKGAYFTKDFMNDLDGGNLCIAAMTFLRYNDKYKSSLETGPPREIQPAH